MNKKIYNYFILIQPLIFITVLLSVFMFVKISKRNEAQIIVNGIRNSLLIGDYRSCEQVLTSNISDDFYRIAIINDSGHFLLDLDNHSTEKSHLINQILIEIRPAEHNSFAQYKVIFYFSLANVLIYSSLIYLLFFLISIPLTYFIKRKLEKDLATQNELEQSELIKNLALQMSHDIRSPLSAMKSIINDLTQLGDQEKTILNYAVSRINEISNSLLKSSRDNNIASQFETFNLVASLDEIILLKKSELKDISIEYMKNNENTCSMSGIKIEFERIISNLINNSYDARGTQGAKIKINLKKEHPFFILTLEDNGSGISEDVISKIGSTKITTKSNGYGLGLSHAFLNIKNWNGEIKIDSKLGVGTKFIIKLPLIEEKNSQLFILLDNDELTRLNWEYRAKKAEINLKTYSSYLELINDLPSFSSDTKFYIDSDLGDIQGEVVAQKIFDQGFSEIFMATGYEKDKFASLSFIKGTIGKTPPF